MKNEKLTYFIAKTGKAVEKINGYYLYTIYTCNPTGEAPAPKIAYCRQGCKYYFTEVNTGLLICTTKTIKEFDARMDDEHLRKLLLKRIAILYHNGYIDAFNTMIANYKEVSKC